MKTRRRTSWFEQLRRDRALFAIVGALILVANLFQPLAEARAAETTWTICTTHGVTGVANPGETEQNPGHSSGCPCCIAGNHCGSLSAPKLLASASPAFAPLQALGEAAPAVVFIAEPSGLPGDPPPAIRAPPLSA